MGVKVIRKQALDIVLKIAISPGSATLAITMLDAYKQSSRTNAPKTKLITELDKLCLLLLAYPIRRHCLHDGIGYHDVNGLF